MAVATHEQAREKYLIYDYIIVGAGSAGCTLAYRLSANPQINVILIEAGGKDSNAMIRVPKGFAKVLFDPDLCWYFDVNSDGAGSSSEIWPRGKTLGGSSSVNGSLYVRGWPEDFDDWSATGVRGWNWADLEPGFIKMENHFSGAGSDREAGGPLHITTCYERRTGPPACEAFIQACEGLGVPFKDDFNGPGSEGVGYFPQTVHRGRRWSAADAFLRPAISRANLTVITNLEIERIEFSGTSAVGVSGHYADGSFVSLRAREVILSCGAIQSPKLLQVSGIGPSAHLSSLGIQVICDLPGVGANMREHRYLRFQWRLKRHSFNQRLRGAGLFASMAQYMLTRRGVLATGAADVGAAVRTRGELTRPDAQINMTPISMRPATGSRRFEIEREPGMHVMVYPMRPQSHGSVMCRSAEGRQQPTISPKYSDSEEDRNVIVGMVRFIDRLFEQGALKSIVERKIGPEIDVNDSDSIIETFERIGGPCQHAVGTCSMGNGPMSVVDERLRVRGVSGLRVIDGSVMPSMVSGNTNAPIMAIAWRAADLMLEERRPSAEHT